MRGLPTVGVLDDKQFPGTAAWSQEMAFLECLPLDEALQRRWGTDAHFTCYTIPGETAWPRINKGLVGAIREKGADVKITCCVQDYDNEDHAHWTPELRADFEERLGELIDEGFEPALNWTAFYYTRSGARFVWVYDEPVDLEESEQRHRGMIKLWREQGVLFDEACSNWGRIFRLPYVLRDGAATLGELELQPENRLDPSTIPLVGSKGLLPDALDIQELDLPQPTPEEALGLLWTTNEKQRTIMSDWQRLAKFRLRGRDCYPCIWEDASLAPPGARDDTILRFVGQAAGLCYNLPCTTPEHIYALFLSAAEQLDPDDDTDDWTVVLWRAVLRCWAGEKAQVDKQTAKTKKLEQAGDQTREEMLDGVRAWKTPPREVLGDQWDSINWLNHHMIAIVGQGYHLMLRDGSFDSFTVRQIDHLSVRIREMELEGVIPLRYTDGNGAVREVKPIDLVKRHGFNVPAGLHGRATNEPNQLSAYGSEKMALSICLFRRKPDLLPVYAKEVEAWLRQLFSPEDFELVCTWIAYALAIEDGPIAALSIAGPPGCGKKLLAVGLAECFDCETYATSRVFGRFNEDLLRTPMVVVDEGLRSYGSGTGAQDTSDQFRALISGDPISVEPKGKPCYSINVPVRMLFTANNEHILTELAGRKDLSPEDRQALAHRLLHVQAQANAASWLMAKGGLDYTGRPGRRWIRSDAGSPSDYVIAGHFMWLYANRARRPRSAGGRFLVAGDPSRVARVLDSAGSAPAVTQAVIELIEHVTGRAGVHINRETCEVYVTSEAVSAHLRKEHPMLRSKDHRQCGNALRHLLAEDHTDLKATLVDGANRRLRARWKKLDPAILLSYAEDHGLNSAKLAEIVGRLELDKTIG